MAIAFVESKAADLQFGGNISITFAATPANGELILLHYTENTASASTVTPPTGFTVVESLSQNFGGNNFRSTVWKKLASSESSATYTVTVTGGNNQELQGQRWTGASSTLDATATGTSNAFTAAITAPSVTSVAGGVAVQFVAANDGFTAQSPAGWTIATPALSNVRLRSGYKTIAATTASGSGQYGASGGSLVSYGHSLVIADAGGGGGGVTSTVAWTEADDTVAATLTETITSTEAHTEADDTVTVAVTESFPATVAWTEADDTVAASAAQDIPATVTYTEADDTVAASAAQDIPTSVAFTEADDTITATASEDTPTTVAWVEADDTVAASVTVVEAGDLVIAWTEEDDTAVAALLQTIPTTAAWTEADDTVTAAADVVGAVTATAAWTEEDDAAVAALLETIPATVTWVEADDTVTANAAVSGTGIFVYTWNRIVTWREPQPQAWREPAPAVGRT